ncbi:MAG: hypothetical protein AAFR82_00110 [Pseudomonadota bacterium]
MPYIASEQDKPIELHRDHHRLFPFRSIIIVFGKNGLQCLIGIFIACGFSHAWPNGRGVPTRRFMLENMRAALAMFVESQVDNPGPMAKIDMYARTALITF